MFEIIAQDSTLEILTFELDARLDLAMDNGLSVHTDGLEVEVYTLVGEFADHVHDPEAWELISDVFAPVSADGNGVVIPSSEFDTVVIPTNSTQSFYVTFRDAYLDYNVDVATKAGEKQLKHNGLALMVGEGTNFYKFPMALETAAYPQFAGVRNRRHLAMSGVSCLHPLISDSFPSRGQPCVSFI